MLGTPPRARQTQLLLWGDRGACPLERESDLNRIIREQDYEHCCPGGSHLTAFVSPVPPSSSLLSCLSLPAGRIQIIPGLPSLPQGLWQISGAGTGVSGMVIYQGECSKPAPHPFSRLPDYSLILSSANPRHLAPSYDPPSPEHPSLTPFPKYQSIRAELPKVVRVSDPPTQGLYFLCITFPHQTLVLPFFLCIKLYYI